MIIGFGVAPRRSTRTTTSPLPLPEDTVFTSKSTEHKDHVLLYSSTFVFDEAKLGRNVKRYTNSQARMPCKGLCALLAAAERE